MRNEAPGGDLRICIIGAGNIGVHMERELGAFRCSFIDPLRGYDAPYAGAWEFAFVCVPTDMREDGSCDTSIVEDVVRKTDAKIIVIKSAIIPGTARQLTKKYPAKHLVVSPEFFGTTPYSINSVDFVILGGEREDCAAVARLYWRIQNGSLPISFTGWEAAELVKYMENSFLALKVTFCAEFAKLAGVYGVEYAELRELMVLDKRFGFSHSYVFPEKPYYDSHCLNKDTMAIIADCEAKTGEKPPLLAAMHKINLKVRQEEGKL